MIKDPERHARALCIFLHSLIQVGSEMAAVMGYIGKRHRCFSNAYALGPGVLDAQCHDMNDADMERNVEGQGVSVCNTHRAQASTWME